MKTAPRGYPKDHPRIALLRHRSLFAGRRLGRRREGITRQAAINHARATFDACGPMNAWLDEYVGAGLEEDDLASKRSSTSGGIAPP